MAFSNESQSLLYHNNGHQFVRCRPGEACRPDCVQPALKHNVNSVMVRCCMSKRGVSELVLVNGHLYTSDYVSLLCKALPASFY